jgi:hypothetical protein
MRVALTVGLVLLVAGCSAGQEPQTSASSTSASSSPASSTTVAGPPEVPGLTAEAVRLRTDEALGGQVHVRVSNTGDAAFTVTSVQLVTPGFTVLPATPVEAEYPPGRVIALPTPFGVVDCAAEPDPAEARLTVTRPDGAVEDLRVPLAGGTLAQVHGEECAVAAVTAVVGVDLTGLAGAGETLTGEVVLTRRTGTEPVEVSFLGGSVVLEPVPDAELPVTLAPGDQQLRLPVTFDAERCDPHALGETKKPFVFPLTVSVGDGSAVAVDLPIDEADRAQLSDLLDRVCTG